MSDLTKLHGALDFGGERAASRQMVYVYEAPVRLWHWVNALCIVVLAISGYLIGAPLPSTPGEASASFLMGYIRFAHFAAGEIVAVGLLLRIYWAFVGNRNARQLFMPPVWDRTWRWGVLNEMKWYMFLVKQPKKYVGHNPLAHIFMFGFMLLLVFQTCTGFALYAEGMGRDSWQYSLFGWVFSIWPNSQAVHTWHHLAMWGIVVFVILHIYAAIREDIMSRQSMISSIVSGERVFRDEFDS